MLNMVVMCLDTYNQSEKTETILNFINAIFIVIFTLECIMKLIALHWRFFTLPWNVFDFSVVLLSILGKYIVKTLAK